MKKKNILPLFLLLFVISNGYAATMVENITQKIQKFEANIKKKMQEHAATIAKRKQFAIKLEAKIVNAEIKLHLAKAKCKILSKFKSKSKEATQACANKRLWSAKLKILKRIDSEQIVTKASLK